MSLKPARTNLRPVHTCPASLLILVVLTLAATPAAADRWYEDYQRAVALVETGECSTEAIQLLGAASVARPEAGRKARTYALRNLDYLPYYQLARAFLACDHPALVSRFVESSRTQGAATAEELAAVEKQLRDLAANRSAASEAAAKLAALEQRRSELAREIAQLDKQRQQLSGELETARAEIAAEQSRTLSPILEDRPVIGFAAGATDIDGAGRIALARVAGMLAVTRLPVRVEGHTDSTGTDSANQTISEQRAQAVQAFLIEQGVAAENTEATGFGADRPLADNSTAEGRDLNRRVEVVVVMPGQGPDS